MKCLFKSYPVIIEYKIWQTPNTNVLFWDFPLRIEENETKYFIEKKLNGMGGVKVEIVEIFSVKLIRAEKRWAGQEMETEGMQSQITSDRFHQKLWGWAQSCNKLPEVTVRHTPLGEPLLYRSR